MSVIRVSVGWNSAVLDCSGRKSPCRLVSSAGHRLGLGLDRMAMVALGIHDIRELFTNNLDMIPNDARRVLADANDFNL